MNDKKPQKKQQQRRQPQEQKSTFGDRMYNYEMFDLTIKEKTEPSKKKT
jgi:hypothetical protein